MSQIPAARPGMVPAHPTVVHIRPRRPRQPKAPLLQRVASPRPIHLEERDQRILEALGKHRFLATEQLRRLCFTEPQGRSTHQLCHPSLVRRRLRALFDHRLINRLPTVAQPTRGIPPLLYTLSRDGAAALSDLTGRPVMPTLVGDRQYRVLRHRLKIVDFYIALHEAVRGTGYSVSEWRHEEELRVASPDGTRRAEVITHPLLKKSPTEAAPGSGYFLPDAFFQLRYGTGDSVACFLEMDLATERHSVWKRRAKVYTAYADPASGLFRRRFGRQSFRVLIATTPLFRKDSRRDNILRAIRESVGPTDLFLAAALDDLELTVDPDTEKKRPGLLGAVWRPALVVAPPCSFLPKVMISPKKS